MRARARRRSGQRNALPPQIFNGEDYRGDFTDFDVANEETSKNIVYATKERGTLWFGSNQFLVSWSLMFEVLTKG